eukprot:7384236-Prymnesium_polylepis.1
MYSSGSMALEKRGRGMSYLREACHIRRRRAVLRCRTCGRHVGGLARAWQPTWRRATAPTHAMRWAAASPWC